MSAVPLFQRYIQIAEVLGQMFPSILEVVVHDFSDLDHSVIFIVNGHISGREVGAGASELGLRRLLKNENIPDVLINYTNVNPRGNRLKSSSLAIRDDKGQMIGAFCLNFDISAFEHFQSFLSLLMRSELLSTVGEGELAPVSTVEEEIQLLVQDYLIQQHLVFSQLTYADKQAIVAYLDQKKCFRQRGAVIAVATVLQLTRQSIYNYLNKEKSS